MSYFKRITEHFHEGKDWIDAAPGSLDCESNLFPSAACGMLCSVPAYASYELRHHDWGFACIQAMPPFAFASQSTWYSHGMVSSLCPSGAVQASLSTMFYRWSFNQNITYMLLCNIGTLFASQSIWSSHGMVSSLCPCKAVQVSFSSELIGESSCACCFAASKLSNSNSSYGSSSPNNCFSSSSGRFSKYHISMSSSRVRPRVACRMSWM